MGIKVVRFVCFANWGEENESVLRSLASMGDRRDSNWTKHQSLQDPFIGLGCVYAADNRRFTSLFWDTGDICLCNALFQATISYDPRLGMPAT